METEINIVEILKDKPQGTKLYSSACGKCKLEEVDDKSFKISFYNSKFGFMNGGEGYLDKNGKLYDDGECIIFPSKEMRATAAYAQDDIFGCSSPRLDAPSGNIPSDKQKCQPKAQHEFIIKGIKIMAASKKDAIKKYNHHKK